MPKPSLRDQLLNGVANAVADIRQAVVMNGWFGQSPESHRAQPGEQHHERGISIERTETTRWTVDFTGNDRASPGVPERGPETDWTVSRSPDERAAAERQHEHSKEQNQDHDR